MRNIKKKLAIKLVEVLSINEISEEITVNTIRNAFSTVMNDNDIEDIIDKYLKYYNVNVLLEEISVVYINKYTEDELIDLINFFSSNTGKKWIKNYPIILNEIFEITEQYGASIAEEILKKY